MQAMFRRLVGATRPLLGRRAFVDGVEGELRHPVPPFSSETAALKVRLAEDAWNTRDANIVSGGYSVDTRWRNRVEFITGREQVVSFLSNKWRREQNYRLIKQLWAFGDDKIAVRFAYEYQHSDECWFRCYGNENWYFHQDGRMHIRLASINDVAITSQQRLFHWPLGRRPDDHPSLSDLDL